MLLQLALWFLLRLQHCLSRENVYASTLCITPESNGRVACLAPLPEVWGYRSYALSLPFLADCLHFMRFWDVFVSLLSSGRGSLLTVFVSLRQKYQKYYRTHKILVVLLHFLYYSQGLYSVQFLFEEHMDTSIAKRLCSSVQRRQAVVEIQWC